jgi:hypothetical protein
MPNRPRLLLVCAALAAACNQNAASPPDGAAAPDDASASPTGGPPEGGASPDAAGPVVTCLDRASVANPWAPVAADLHLPADRGRLLACTRLATVDAATLDANPVYVRYGWHATTGYEQLLVQYASEGPPGTARRVTALVYFPTSGDAALPVAAVNHYATGLGPTCGATHFPFAADEMAMPLAGHGYAVVATDYLGEGVDDGVSPFLVGAAEASAILDGVRALRAMNDPRFPSSRLGDELFFVGHSQGAQASLFAHAAAAAAGADPSLGRLLGSVAFAPALGDERQVAGLFANPLTPVGAGTVLTALVFLGDADWAGTPAPTDWLSPTAAAMLPAMAHDQCVATLLGNIPLMWPENGALFSASFLAAAATCPFDGATPCPGLGALEPQLRADVPGDFASTAPALLLQGEADTLVNPWITACVAKRLAARGTPAAACGYALSDHFSIVNDAIADALAWMEARRAGDTPSVCPAPIAEACP